MADSIRYSVSATPLETVAQSHGFVGEDVNILHDVETHSVDVIATEVQKTYGSSGEVTLGTQWGTTASTLNGIALGVQNYREAVDSNDTTAISTETYALFVFIKNTGFASDGDNTQTLTNLLDKSLKIMEGTYCISCLAAGESFVMKAVGSSTIDCNRIHVRTVDNDGGDNVSAGHLAVEYLVAK